MQCEGYIRHGGAFTLGPVEWVQCSEKAQVMLTVRQEKVEKMPACLECWQRAIDFKIEILDSKPITDE